jgi:pimeloyl-ACP methyl ester carboxylesterase
VVGLSVPFADRALCPLPGNPFGEVRPKLIYGGLAGPGQTFYQDCFGRMDAIVTEFESDVRGWLLGATWSFSGDALSQLGINMDQIDPVELLRGTPLCIPDGSRMRDRFMPPPAALPDWFNAADLDFMTGEFERSGFAGALSYFHNFDNDWELLGYQSGKPVTVPALYIGGEFDVFRTWGREALVEAPKRIPNYQGTRIVAGSGHWIPQERPAEVNKLLVDFLQSL